MENFVIEKYLVYVKDVLDNSNVIYIIEKREDTAVTIKRLSGKQKEEISLCDIKDDFIRKCVGEINNKIKYTQFKYAVKYLTKFFRNGELDIVKHGNVKEYNTISNNRYSIRIVRYYYDPKGKLYQRLFMQKWK